MTSNASRAADASKGERFVSITNGQGLTLFGHMFDYFLSFVVHYYAFRAKTFRGIRVQEITYRKFVLGVWVLHVRNMV